MQLLQKIITIGDSEIKVFSIAYLAAQLHRRPSAIKKWEWQKRIPKPILRTLDGRRWYTQEEVDIYRAIVEEENVRAGQSFAKTKFCERIFGEINILRRKLEKEIQNGTA